MKEGVVGKLVVLLFKRIMVMVDVKRNDDRKGSSTMAIVYSNIISSTIGIVKDKLIASHGNAACAGLLRHGNNRTFDSSVSMEYLKGDAGPSPFLLSCIFIFIHIRSSSILN